MPEAIGLLIIGEETAAAIGSAIGVSASVVATTVGSVVLTAAAIGLQFALQPGLPTPAAGHESIRQPIPSRRYVYGKTRLAGVYMLYEETQNTSYDVVAICQGPVAHFQTFYLHDDEISYTGDPLASVAVVASAIDIVPDDGRYEQGEVSFSVRLGAPTETVYTQVSTVGAFVTIWDSTHRGDGIASMCLVCYPPGQNSFVEVYPRGLPSPSAVIIGPLCWDFRDNTQNPASPASWIPGTVWSSATTYALNDRVAYNGAAYISATASNLNNQPDISTGIWISVNSNPVIQLVDFLIDPDHGMGLDRATLIDPVISTLATEANHCDELVQKASLDYEPRYQSSGFYNYDTDPTEVFGAILATCDGWLSQNGDGTIALVVGVYRTSPITLKNRHILRMSIDDGVADELVVNELDISFTYPSEQYRQVAGQPWRDETDISARGVTRSQALDLTWVQSHPQARRLAKRAMGRLQAPYRGTMVTTLYGLAVLGARWVPLQYTLISEIANCVVEIQNAEIDFTAGTVTLDWLFVDPTTIDAWDPATEEGSPPPDPNDIAGDVLPVPQNVAAHALPDATDTQFAFIVTFNDPQWPVGALSYNLRYRVQDAGGGVPGPWIEQFTVSATTDGVTVTLQTGVVQLAVSYILEVASAGPTGVQSAWSADVLVSSDPLARTTEDATQRAGEDLVPRDMEA